MTIIPSGLIANMDAYTRHPTVNLGISWDNSLTSGEWFRLDESFLDSNSILTLSPYLDGQEIQEVITDADARVYVDESEYVLMLEGFSQLIGDNFQYSMSDMDCELDNTNNRFTPREGTNRLENPGFELSKQHWNESVSTQGSAKVDEDNERTGVRCLQLNNPSTEPVYIFSDIIETNDGDVTSIPESWTYSQYVRGAGDAALQLLAFSQSNSGVQNISTGLLAGAAYNITLVSGQWSRYESSLIVPSGTFYIRAMMTVSGTFMRADDGQVEEGYVATEFDPEFIGNFIVPKRSIKLEVGFSDINVPRFVGLTNKIVPKLKEDSTQIYAYDWANALKDKKITGVYYENYRTDQLIQALGGLAGVDTTKMRLETGTLTVEFAWFQEGSIWFYLTQVAEAEGGRVFFDEEGTLIFWNRNHYSVDDPVIYTFTFEDHIQDLNYEVSSSKVKNRIELKASPKKLVADKVIYDLEEVQSIAAGATQEFWGQYAYLSEKSVPALNVDTPVIGVDILANAQEDGLGANLSSYVEISSIAKFQESTKINLKNNYGSTVYITKLQIKGDPIATKSRIEVIEEDVSSKALYDTQILAIENDLIDDETFANDLAAQKLAELKDPMDFITIDVVGVPYLQCGDKISVQRSFDGEMENFYIVSNRWKVDDDFTQSLELQKRVIVN
jgi:hypothetical protein